MVKGHESEETGFGIDVAPADDAHTYLLVDMKENKVKHLNVSNRRVKKTWTFEEFVAASINF